MSFLIPKRLDITPQISISSAINCPLGGSSWSTDCHPGASFVLRVLNHTLCDMKGLTEQGGCAVSPPLPAPLIPVQGQWAVPHRIGHPQRAASVSSGTAPIPATQHLPTCLSPQKYWGPNVPESDPQTRKERCWRTHVPASCPSGDNPTRNSTYFSEVLESQRLNPCSLSWTLTIHCSNDLPSFPVPLPLSPPPCSLG